MAVSCEHSNELSACEKYGEFLDWSKCKLVKKEEVVG